MPSAWQMLCQPGGAGSLGELAPAAAMWAAMVLAMMLPTAGPMILTYAEIADTAARKGEPVVSPMVLSAGYALVWLGFALVAATGQWMLTSASLPLGGDAARLAAGTIFLGAGLYQFSRAQAGLSGGVSAAISIFLFQLDHRSRAACSGSAFDRGCSASAAAGR